ncbi:MAG TPA: class I SAM-dependent methyltransferase [Roseiflexaceae bacterium]|nr:class I SAM-dependent methyltransferase [Roseiflexaceae bacterium]
MQQRVRSVRQLSPRRKPWHVDYLAMRALLADIVAHGDYAQGRLLDVGCGSRPYEPLLGRVSEYVGLDVVREAGRPNAIGLGWQLPFAPASFDSLLCTQTLEHVESPSLVVAEMARVLRPSGYLILTAPQTWRLHEKPYDFFRYTRFGLQSLLEQSGLRVIAIKAQGGVWATIGQMINNAIHQRIRPRLPIYAVYLLYLATNLLFGTLDQLWVDQDETINYLAIAQKV